MFLISTRSALFCFGDIELLEMPHRARRLSLRKLEGRDPHVSNVAIGPDLQGQDDLPSGHSATDQMAVESPFC